MEIERNKWREMMELDGSKSNSLTSRMANLEAENEDLRRSVIFKNYYEFIVLKIIFS